MNQNLSNSVINLTKEEQNRLFYVSGHYGVFYDVKLKIQK